MALPLRLGKIAEARAAVAKPAVVEDLDLPALEEELAVHPRRLHDLIQRLQRRLALGVEGHFRERVAVAHLEAR